MTVVAWSADVPDSVSSSVSPGRLFPELHALVSLDPTGYVLIDAATGMRCHVRGPICDEIERSLAISSVTPGLRRMAAAHPALAELTRWMSTPSVPLTRYDAVRLDGFDTLFVELLGRCNERCVHCYADASPTVSDALDRDTVLSVIEQAHALGFRRIQLTGGDPLLCDFLPEAVQHARRRGIPHIELFTNGLALTESLLAELAPSEPMFAFSFYSLDADVHDRMTRTPGSHGRTLAAIDRVVARGLAVRAAVIVIDQDTDLEPIIEFLRGRGVQEISWTRTYSVGRGQDVAEMSRGTTVLHNEAGAPVPVGGHRGASSAGHVARNGKLCITYSGDVVPCIFQRQVVLGNVRSGATLHEMMMGHGAAAPRRGLPKLADIAQRLQCSSCRLTETVLAHIGETR